MHENGVTLHDNNIDWIIHKTYTGVNEVYDWLSIEPTSRTLPFFCGIEENSIGYVPNFGINIPICFFRSIQQFEKINPDITQSKFNISNIDGFNISNVSLDRYLKFAGREEAIHHYQYLRHPKLHARMDDPELYSKSTKLMQALSDIEVEARTVSDHIASNNNDEPLWRDFDAYLIRNYPNLYNKPLI